MSDTVKPVVSYETFASLDIRAGRVLEVRVAEGAPKAAYVIKADFGKFGVRTSVGRFTKHEVNEIKGRLILGVLNLGSREIAGMESQFLCLGVQFPKADSGEATPITVLSDDAKIGSKLF